MVNKIIPILFVCITISLKAYAQKDSIENNYHFLGYVTGINSLKEEVLLPKVHTGNINEVIYKFEKHKRNFHAIQLTIGYSTLKTKLEREKVTQNGQINLDYSVGYKIWSNENIKYLLGYNVKYSWSIIEFPVWDESRAYWSTSLSLALYNRLIVTTKKGYQWISTLDICLLGILSRPDKTRLYAQEDWSFLSILNTTHSDFKFGLMNSIFINHFNTEYRIPLKKGRYLSFSYSLLYSKCAKSNEPALSINRNNFGLGFGL